MKNNLMYDEDDVVVWLYYINHKLYGWTTKKDDRNFFESQRNMNVFKRKKRIMNQVVFRGFMIKYKDQQIIDIPVEYGGKTYLIRGTYAEDSQLYLKCDEICKGLESLSRYFANINNNVDIPKKYKQSIDLLLHFSTLNENKDSVLNINTLSLFYKLFKFTF